MKKLFLILTASTLLFASCKEDWSEENKKQYMDGCMEQAASWTSDQNRAKAYCDCSMEVIMKHYSTIDEVMENKDSVALNKELQACRQK